MLVQVKKTLSKINERVRLTRIGSKLVGSAAQYDVEVSLSTVATNKVYGSHMR
jgi:hypothetical protein